MGLGIEAVWSRPCYLQDNGIVERSHRVTQAWSAPLQDRNGQSVGIAATRSGTTI
ncbi:MAG: hypothetical protein LDL41_10970 [Coleofasciculus sp. S288]|nr:hypothetical protein [Coleofasciculus sp. S288]